jgi:hypothetical protein
VTATQPVINDKDWTKTLEYLSEDLVGNIGEKGNPLSYVILPQVDLPPRQAILLRDMELLTWR